MLLILGGSNSFPPFFSYSLFLAAFLFATIIVCCSAAGGGFGPSNSDYFFQLDETISPFQTILSNARWPKGGVPTTGGVTNRTQAVVNLVNGVYGGKFYTGYASFGSYGKEVVPDIAYGLLGPLQYYRYASTGGFVILTGLGAICSRTGASAWVDPSTTSSPTFCRSTTTGDCVLALAAPTATTVSRTSSASVKGGTASSQYTSSDGLFTSRLTPENGSPKPEFEYRFEGFSNNSVSWDTGNSVSVSGNLWETANALASTCSASNQRFMAQVYWASYGMADSLLTSNPLYGITWSGVTQDTR